MYDGCGTGNMLSVIGIPSSSFSHTKFAKELFALKEKKKRERIYLVH